MAIIARIACDKGATPSRPDAPMCPYIDVPTETVQGLGGDIIDALTAAGWSAGPDGYHCPRHNPAVTGLPIVLSEDYIEPVPGIRIRLNTAARADAELLLDKARYDVDNPGAGAVWRAKHVSEEWTT